MGHPRRLPDPAGTITTRIGKGINTTLDDGRLRRPACSRVVGISLTPTQLLAPACV
jgi:hypothetical protein